MVKIVDTTEVIRTTGALANYGWPTIEGVDCNFGAAAFPVNQMTCDAMRPQFTSSIFIYRNNGGTSAIGGYVYRGLQDPRLTGGYVFADYQRCVRWQNNRYDSYSCAGPNLIMLDEVSLLFRFSLFCLILIYFLLSLESIWQRQASMRHAVSVERPFERSRTCLGTYAHRADSRRYRLEQSDLVVHGRQRWRIVDRQVIVFLCVSVFSFLYFYLIF